MSTCPKCGYKLKITDIKQNCPKCGVNLMYYNMEQRLEQDAVKAQADEEKFKSVLAGIRASSIGSVLSVARIVLYIASIAALFIPIFSGKNIPYAHMEGSVSLITLISAMTAEGASIMDVLFGSPLAIMFTVYFVGTVLTALVSLILSLFSFTKHGTARNVVTAVIAILLQGIIGAMAVLQGLDNVDYGFFVGLILVVITLVFHLVIGKKIKKQ